jgi:hypothetical protein
MFTIQKLIDYGFRSLFALCILPLYLAVPALSTAASSANPAAWADGMHLSSNLIDLPDILVPKPPPPPPPYEGVTAMERTASNLIDLPDILVPKPPPPPPPYEGTAAMEQTA